MKRQKKRPPKGYMHHVFISYPAGDATTPWVTKLFEPELRKWLGALIPGVKIFFDNRDLIPGDDWERVIITSHLRSCCLVPIWLPPYFESKWCMAEWTNMKKREQAIAQRDGGPVALIYPVVFAGRENLPADARRTQAVDLSMFRSHSPEFINTRDFIEFERKMQKIADDLCERIQSVPNWSADWTFETPGDNENWPPRTTPSNPRL
jgi:TIR domain